MTDPPVPPQAITVAAVAIRQRWHPPVLNDPDVTRFLAAAALEAAAPLLAAAERERACRIAESLQFRLYRPSRGGPGGGQQALDAVPLTELLHLLREDPHAT